MCRYICTWYYNIPSSKLIIVLVIIMFNRNFKLWTPLTYAAKVGSEPLTEMLIKAGAEIDPKDRFKVSSYT